MFVCNFNQAIWWLFLNVKMKDVFLMLGTTVLGLDTSDLLWWTLWWRAFLASLHWIISVYQLLSIFREKNYIVLNNWISLLLLWTIRPNLIKNSNWWTRIRKYQWPWYNEKSCRRSTWPRDGHVTLGDLLECPEPVITSVKRIWGQNNLQYSFRIQNYYTAAN